jgi:hypothetical protein
MEKKNIENIMIEMNPPNIFLYPKEPKLFTINEFSNAMNLIDEVVNNLPKYDMQELKGESA